MNRRWTRRAPFDAFGPLSLALVLLSCSFPSRGAAEPHDCGFEAIYILLRVEGFAPTLADLEAELPAPSPRGYSLLELRDAASSCGLDLSGVRLPDGPGALHHGPALVYLQRGQSGHFVVIRPVDREGRLIQVIDSNRRPYIRHAADLRNSPEWTGLALIPRRPTGPARIVGGSALITALIAVSLRIIPRMRAPRRIRCAARAS